MGNPYYEDEYEDYDDYEDYDPDDYCPYCLHFWEDCFCEWENKEAESYCTCGGILDAHGNCPYCDYLPEGAVVLHVYNPKFEVEGQYDDYGEYCSSCGKYYLHCDCSGWSYEENK